MHGGSLILFFRFYRSSHISIRGHLFIIRVFHILIRGHLFIFAGFRMGIGACGAQHPDDFMKLMTLGERERRIGTPEILCVHIGAGIDHRLDELQSLL